MANLFSFGKNLKRARILSAPWPPDWDHILNANLAHAALLKEHQSLKWKQTIQVLVAEKNWDGCDGLAVTDEVKVTIAAQAALILLGIEHDYFAKLRSVVKNRACVYADPA